MNMSCWCSCTLGNTMALLLPLLNVPGSTHMPDLCHFQDPATRQPEQHLLCGLSKMDHLMHSTDGGSKQWQ